MEPVSICDFSQMSASLSLSKYIRTWIRNKRIQNSAANIFEKNVWAVPLAAVWCKTRVLFNSTNANYFLFLFSVSINATESAQYCWQVSWEHDKHSEMLRSASGSFSVSAKHLIIKHRAGHYRTLNCSTSPEGKSVGSLGTDAAAQLYQDKTKHQVFSYTPIPNIFPNPGVGVKIAPHHSPSAWVWKQTRGWHNCINLWIP